MPDRSEGNPNQRRTDQEESRLGRQRTPDDIPKQDHVKRGVVMPGNVDESQFQPSTVETGGVYAIGPALRPNIVHDNGHLVLGKRAPALGDYAELAKWRAMLAGGEALRPDLVDALAAYRHFLDGNGKQRLFSYDRYVMSDTSGQATLRNAILDFQFAVIDLWTANEKPREFLMTGPGIPCGAASKSLSYLSDHFPYPATENWQKAIGAHTIWLSGRVQVFPPAAGASEVLFKATMTLHAEDRYNFNPGAADIVTGMPDSDNGRFEVTGLAQQFDNLATLTRLLEWRGFQLGVGLAARPNTTRLRQPGDNRRLRNRL